MFTLEEREFKYISNEVYQFARINLTQKKKFLIVSRLSKRIRALKLNGFPQYVEFLKNNDPERTEFQRMVDALSTNYSLFFREEHHFEYLVESILPQYGSDRLNIWSAAASNGQEIYSILITLLEYKKQSGSMLSYKLFASDISSDALRYAASGIYPQRDIEKIPHALLSTYFLKGRDSSKDMVKIRNDLIRQVRFFRLNLSDEKYRIPIMDIIFLRNVIIYFDKSTKIELISRLYDYLTPEGYLFLGHSESLSGISDQFIQVGRTIYRRRD